MNHKGSKKSLFWTSYSDLMTSLFFTMLVLFVLVIILLHKRIKATESQLAAIKEVVNSTKDLDRTYFEYRPDFKKYILKVDCQFPVNGHDIDMLSDSTQKKLTEAGLSVKDFLDRHKNTEYLIIIEGQASRNSEAWMVYNYDLSYLRAFSLRRYWEDQGIRLGYNCELQIAGSGDGRLNLKTMREKEEPKNQRFLIYIIPKNIIEEK